MNPQEIKQLKEVKKMIACERGISTVKCNSPAEFINQNGVCVCSFHKLLLDSFTWENRNQRQWRKLTKADESFTARLERERS